MKKKHFSLILLLFCCYSFAQSKDKAAASETVVASKTDIKPASETVNMLPAKAVPAQVFEKKPFPKDQKAAPATFYVENDKPCDRQEYMRHLKQSDPEN